MKQKVIIRVALTDEKSRKEAFKTVLTCSGVESVGVLLDKDHLEVVGEGIDPVWLAVLLRKKFAYAEIVSVGPIKKKDGDERKGDEKRFEVSVQGDYFMPPKGRSEIFEINLPLHREAEEDVKRVLAENRMEEEPGLSAGQMSEASSADYQITVEVSASDFVPSLLVEGPQSLTIHEKHVLECKLFLFLFLVDCEFDKDQMVQLWVAEGIFEPEIGERMEVLGGSIFDSMVEMNLILPSRFDNIYGLWKYRFNKNIAFALDYFDETRHMLPSDDYLRVVETQLGNTSKLTRHLSLVCENCDMHTLEVLKDFRDLRTLILISHGTSINHVPHDLFHYLKNLRSLDMHEFSLSEVPSSITYLESLQYLDVSGSSIRYLPESIGSLYSLQTLKLKGCLELHALPTSTKDLICLRHLDLDILGQLMSMPSGIGSLTNLQTLSAYLVGTEEGNHVRELKNLVNLSGTFCISGLENISNPDEAREAELINKKYLSKLQLRWGGLHHDGSEAEDMILEYLQPHFGIKELGILFFNGTKLPTWISAPSLSNIVSISLFQCRNCSLLPSLGRLPSLKFLEIYEMNGIRVIDHSFCRNDEDQELGHPMHHKACLMLFRAPKLGGCQAFPKLEKLTLDGLLNLEQWTGVEIGDFPRMLEFKLRYCPKLRSVPFLSKLQSLKFLEIVECTELQEVFKKGLPASLEILIVKDCPRVKERCANPNARDWAKIAHVPSVFLDQEEICPKKLNSC